MIKTFKCALFVIGLSIFLFACKKEIATEATSFAYLNISNRTTYTEGVSITYNGFTLKSTNDGLNNIKVPAGQGKMSFVDATGKSVLDTNFISVAGKTTNWVLFQPVNDMKPVIVENNSSTEPQPDADHIKIKLANFDLKAFPKPIDVIFYSLDQNTSDLIEGGRIDNVGQNFPSVFSELQFKGVKNASVVVMIVDHKTQEPLLDDVLILVYLQSDSHRVLTLYITESEGGYPVTGTPYKILVSPLFEN